MLKMLKKDTKVKITKVGASRWEGLEEGDEGYVVDDRVYHAEVQVPLRDEHSGGDSWPLYPDEFEIIDGV
jgi:hypothetical protein